MRPRPTLHHFRRAIALAALLTACNDSSSPIANPRVTLEDQCDPTSFNAALGAGACTGTGSMTLSQFNAELSSTQQVAAWRFVPATLTIRVGQTIAAMNAGVEQHTFTEVANFGGGIVPSLNNASGNPVEAPECAQLGPNDFVASGQSFLADAATSVGTEKYQCCIHPWMRAVVTVTN